MADVATILKDPNFHALPIEERRKVLTTVDPNFAALPSTEQDKVFAATMPTPYNAPARGDKLKGPQTGLGDGFMGTLASDFASIPEAAYNLVRHPYDSAKGAYDSLISIPEATGDMYAKGQFGKMGARLTEGALMLTDPGATGTDSIPKWDSSKVTAAERLRDPGVISAATDFIPYVGPSTGVKAKSIKLGKAWLNAKKPLPQFPMTPEELSPTNFSPSVDPWSKGPALPPPPQAPPNGIDFNWEQQPIFGQGQRSGPMDYEVPPVAAPSPTAVPKPKAAPKPKPLTKTQLEANTQFATSPEAARGPYSPPPFQPTQVPTPPQATAAPWNPPASSSMEYGGPEPVQSQKPRAVTPADKEALDSTQFSPSQPVGLPRPPEPRAVRSLTPPPAPLTGTMDFEAPPQSPTRPGKSGGGSGTAPEPGTTTISQDMLEKLAKAAAELDRLKKEGAKGPGPGGEGARTPGTVEIRSIDNLPARYSDTLKEHGAAGAMHAWNKDIQVVKHLRGEGITAEQWLKLGQDEQNAHFKGAGLKVGVKGGYRNLGKGGSSARPAQVGIQHVYEAFSDPE